MTAETAEDEVIYLRAHVEDLERSLQVYEKQALPRLSGRELLEVAAVGPVLYETLGGPKLQAKIDDELDEATAWAERLLDGMRELVTQ